MTGNTVSPPIPFPNLHVLMSKEPVPYGAALARMREWTDSALQSPSSGFLWLLEHPPVFTIAPRTPLSDVLSPGTIPVVPTNRGGKATYHGPGQRIAYLIAALVCPRTSYTLSSYVYDLQMWILRALTLLGVPRLSLNPHAPGVWSALGKVASVGVRSQKGVVSHGFAINLSVDLAPFSCIIPCGLASPVTSVHQLGLSHITLQSLDDALLETSPFPLAR